MGDLINREDAINLVKHRMKHNPMKSVQFIQGLQDAYLRVVSDLNRLPSAEPQWIPCSERLPSRGAPVLVSGIMEDAPPITISTDAPLYYKKGWINAWMPLPNPWKGEEE